MAYVGIDYASGTGSNTDPKTGIRYGVISQNSVSSDAANDLEPDYGEPHCPVCGNNAIDIPVYSKTPGESGYGIVSDSVRDWDKYSKYGSRDYICENCKHFLDSSDVFADEAQGFTYDEDGYNLTRCLDSDIFVLASPYYTYAQFCSPCVPGAGNLDNFVVDGVKTYCLGHDWFEDGKAPYPVYSVATGELVGAE